MPRIHISTGHIARKSVPDPLSENSWPRMIISHKGQAIFYYDRYFLWTDLPLTQVYQFSIGVDC